MSKTLKKIIQSHLIIILAIAVVFTSTYIWLVPHAEAAQAFENKGGTTMGSTGASLVVSTTTMSANVLVVVCGTWEGNFTITGVTDTLGTSYTKGFHAYNGTSLRNEVWWGYTTASGADTITMSLTGSAGFRDIGFVSYSGFTSPAVDQVSTTTGSGTSRAAPSVTTTQANEVIYSCYNSFSNSSNFTQGAGYTLRLNITGNDGLGVQDQIVTATGSFTSPMTNAASTIWSGGQITFYDSGGGGAAPTPLQDDGQWFLLFE